MTIIIHPFKNSKQTKITQKEKTFFMLNITQLQKAVKEQYMENHILKFKHMLRHNYKKIFS